MRWEEVAGLCSDFLTAESNDGVHVTIKQYQELRGNPTQCPFRKQILIYNISLDLHQVAETL